MVWKINEIKSTCVLLIFVFSEVGIGDSNDRCRIQKSTLIPIFQIGETEYKLPPGGKR